ncbi:hypothetical protein KTH52_12485 [Acinetobacter baumannii]|nr:hypothetical protein [Acinetobacter baumannii]
MVDYNYLIPIVSFALKQRIVLQGGRALSRRNLYIQICSDLWPMLEWNYLQNDIGFNPKKIKKISDRKARRAFYQSFALYKKIPRPRRGQNVKFWKNEWCFHASYSVSISAETLDKTEEKSDFLFGNFQCSWDLAQTE